VSAPNPFSGTPPLIAYDTEKGQIAISSWQLGTFDARTFVGEGPVEKSGAVEADVIWKNGQLLGSIVNNTSDDFDECYVLAGNEMMRLPALKRGEKFDFPENSPLRAYTTSGLLRGSFQTRWIDNASGVFTTKIISNPQNSTEVSDNNFGQYMRWMYEPPLTGGLFPPMRGEVLFVGFKNRPEDAVQSINTINPDQESHSQATIVRLAPKPARGERFVVPSEHVKIRLHDYSKDTTMNSALFNMNSSGNLEIGDSMGLFSAELPFADEKLKVDSFRIEARTLESSEKQNLILQVYSWTRWEWVSVPFDRPLVNDGVALPVSGRLYFRIVAQTKDKNDSGYNEKFTIGSIRAELTGVVEN
jgi:hypothetical protein